MAKLRKEKRYIAKVDRISEAGNGVIKKRDCGSMISEGGHLLIPEADQEWVGEFIEVEYLGGNKARVISRNISKNKISEHKSNPVSSDYLSNKNDLLGGQQ